MILREGQTKTQEPVDFLFTISSQISLNMHNKGNFQSPEIKVLYFFKLYSLEGSLILF